MKVEKPTTSCLDCLFPGNVDPIRKTVNDANKAKIRLNKTISRRMTVGPPLLVVMLAHSRPRVLSVVTPAIIARRVKMPIFEADLLLKIGWSLIVEREIADPRPKKTLELDKK